MTKQQLQVLRKRLIESYTRALVERPVEVADITMANIGLLLAEARHD